MVYENDRIGAMNRQTGRAPPAEIRFYDVKSQLQRWVYDRSLQAFAAADAERDAIRSAGQLEARRVRMRDKLLGAIGGLPTDAPLNPAPIAGTFGTMHKLATDLLWLNDSLAAIRVYDVLRAVDLARLVAPAHAPKLSLYASGR